MTYSKKLGLPNFSSHSCSVSLQVEIADLTQVTGEVKRLYALTQDAVDREIVEVGYLPDATTYGMNNGAPSNGNEGARNGNHGGKNHNGHQHPDREGAWKCSDRQRELIEKIVRENHLDKNAVEQTAVELFGAGVRQLNRLQASGLIDELLERHGGKRRTGNDYRQGSRRGASR